MSKLAKRVAHKLIKDRFEMKYVEMVKSDPTLAEAMRVLKKALKADPGYYYAWQANIAMQFQDEYSRHKGYKSRAVLHEISNKAAMNFLNLLIKD